MTQTKNEFSTVDFKLSATLMTLGFSVKGTRLSLNSKYAVVFDDTLELQKAIVDYANKKLKVCPISLFDNQTLIHTLTRNRN